MSAAGPLPATARPFTRLAIVNRGEPAMRAIRAVHEWGEERRLPITVIALYTESEPRAQFVRHADEAYPVPDYLDHDALARALSAARADAVWVGWGFVAEDPAFVELCERLGLVFVGPPSDAMRRLGDKVAAKQLAQDAGVPVAPWSGGAVDSEEEALRCAERIGFPLLIKAAAGGGGRGIRRVDGPAQLPAALRSARAEAREAVGDATLLLEAAITGARHVEVQLIADHYGTTWAVGLRDCSCQRKNQKVIEESASTALTAVQERAIMQAAVRLAERAGYRNAGTVEFLFEPATGRFSFLEVNARLQVEHPVTEVTTGLDLVKLQLHVAAGGRLEGAPPVPRGHAIEARICAEDPAQGFAPAPGRVQLLRLPTGPGLRIDAGVGEGDVIPARFDSMIAKVIAHGQTRAEAIARLRRALAETAIVIDGGTTNQGYLRELLATEAFRTGDFDTHWLNRQQFDGGPAPVRHADIALLQAAITLADAETAVDRSNFLMFARRGRPQASATTQQTMELRQGGQRYRLSVAHTGPGRYAVTVDEATIHAELRPVSPHEGRLTAGGRTYRTLTSRQGADVLVEVGGVPHRVSRDDGGTVRTSAPGLVAAIPVKRGQQVAAGDVLAVVEAMKMENSLTAPFAGRVRAVLAAPNTQVGAHAALVQIEPLDDDAASAAGSRIVFTPGDDVDEDGCLAALQRLEWLTLGYDIDARQAAADRATVAEQCRPGLIEREHRLLALFADLRSLTRQGRAQDQEGGVEQLFAFLRSLDAEAEGLPRGFTLVLERVLRAYGVDGLERTPALEEACYRIFLAHQRSAQARPAVLSILERRLELVPRPVGDELRVTLDRLADAEEARDPVLADLARDVRYRYFDEPVIAQATDAAYAEAERRLVAPTRADVESLVRCPQPLVPTLMAHLRDGVRNVRDLLLEVITRRYYRVRSLADFAPLELGAHRFLTAGYEFGEQRRRVAAAFIELDAVGAAATAFAQWAAQRPADELDSLDLYALAPHDDATPARLAAALAPVRGVHRVAVVVTDPERGRGMDAVEIFTFRPGADGALAEAPELRGLHPMMVRRLQLWRLSNFALRRLPSATDVYLFHATAHANPNDERLFAAAEVRDLSELRDEHGRLVSLPELERMFIEALAGMRAFQARRKLSSRPQWNRIMLHVWPVVELSSEQIRTMIARLAPLTEGLGLEMVMVNARLRADDGSERARVLRFFAPTGKDVIVEVDDPPTQPLQPHDEGSMRIVAARRRGMLHPAEVVKLLAPAHRDALPGADQPSGDFRELDLDEHGRLVEVARLPATNATGVVVGLVRNYAARHPEGMQRVLLAGDPTKALGSLAEPECARIIAALDLAEQRGVPLEWFALSAGARIALDSGTENMDWIAAVLRRIVEFTQAGGEINVIVAGVNVGAQPYWNAEATMLMHTRGILIMTPQSTMVLTGKQALDFSGAVSAEDNFGIGGYDRIMGPNGQAQYWARDLAAACRILLRYYEHAYVAPGERFPRRALTTDPHDRDVCRAPHAAPGSPLETVGDIFSAQANPERKLPFDIRAVMRAVSDADARPLERWAALRGGEAAVVWDAQLGGRPVMLLGIESYPLPRRGAVPADGPLAWTSGTLFPRSAKKLARALNAASGRRPVVVLANLAGFDGSPESMRDWQLEFGAEIGRAIVNFRGPIVFCVVSRYHGGAFVVFSQRLNEDLETIALEGSKASVIGGAPAAGVVFARDVDAAAARDPAIVALDSRLAAAEGVERARLRAEREAAYARVRAVKQGELAARFDAVHSVERAVQTGSVSRIIPARSLRPALIEAVERGIERTVAREREADDHAALADVLGF